MRNPNVVNPEWVCLTTVNSKNCRLSLLFPFQNHACSVFFSPQSRVFHFRMVSKLAQKEPNEKRKVETSVTNKMSRRAAACTCSAASGVAPAVRVPKGTRLQRNELISKKKWVFCHLVEATRYPCWDGFERETKGNTCNFRSLLFEGTPIPGLRNRGKNSRKGKKSRPKRAEASCQDETSPHRMEPRCTKRVGATPRPSRLWYKIAYGMEP